MSDEKPDSTPDDVDFTPFKIDDVETRKAETRRKPRQPPPVVPKGSPKLLTPPEPVKSEWNKADETTPVAKDGSKRGRRKGAGSKASRLLADAQDKINRKFGIKNWDPVIMLMMIAADETNDKSLRVSAAGKAAPYVHSTLKQIEVKGDEDNPINVNVMTAKDQLARMLRDIEEAVIQEVLLEDINEDEDEEEED